MYPKLHRSNTLLKGNKVKNLSQEELGEVREVILDAESGRITYAILSSTRVNTLSNKLFAVPWSALDVDPADRKLVLDLSRDTFDTAPAFDAQRWPDFTSQEWSLELHTFYGCEPWEISAAER